MTTLAAIVWAYWAMAHGFSRKAQKSPSTSVPSAAVTWPTGCCMKALVQMMK